MSASERRLADRIERGIERATAAVSWLWLGLIALIVLTVVLRYAFGVGRIELEELQWHLYAVGFAMGIVACSPRDRHVRVDVLRERMRPRTRAWVDLYGLLCLKLPFLALVLWSALPLVLDALATGEESASAGGLPYRWMLKATIPCLAMALGLAALARLLRVLDVLFGEAAPEPPRRRRDGPR